jgi:heat shock protein HtpX
VAPGAAKSPPPLPDEARQRMRETGDLLRRMNGFTFLPCACGMTIKLPPEWKRPQVQCPRCGRRHDLPQK